VICHELLTTSGYAGAPIVAQNDKGEWETIGIQCGYGELEDCRKYNMGTLITKTLLDEFIKPKLQHF